MHDVLAALVAPVHDVLAALVAPVHALPLELLRIWVGAVLFVYFLQAYRHAGDFTAPDGLIDHRLCAKLLPAIRWSLFQPGMPGKLFRAVHLCACAAAVLVALGVYPRALAVFLFAAAVSTYRWNVLVSYLDDCIVHIFCLWLVLLPVGHALTPSSGPGALAATVPGAALRALMANMALVYLVAGAYKFTSPMWRNGSALHAALKTPISRAPGFWTLRHRSVLRLTTYAALVLEPFFGLVFVLPSGSAAKWFLAGCSAVFHLGILATLKIPYANLLMLGALSTAFGPELVGALTDAPAAPTDASALPPGAGPLDPLDPSAVGTLHQSSSSLPSSSPLDLLDPSAIAALALVATLAAMFAWEAGAKWRPISRPYRGRVPDSLPAPDLDSSPTTDPGFSPAFDLDPSPAADRGPSLTADRSSSSTRSTCSSSASRRRSWSVAGWANPLRFALWLVGVFQSYRLFDWVDSRNYHVRYELLRATPDSTKQPALDARSLFPDTMRHLLLQSYLLGNVWLQMDPKALAAVRRTILSRYAARYARSHPNAGTIDAWAIVQRVVPDNLDLARGERRFLMRFSCRDGVATVHDHDAPVGDRPAVRADHDPATVARGPADHGTDRDAARRDVATVRRDPAAPASPST